MSKGTRSSIVNVHEISGRDCKCNQQARSKGGMGTAFKINKAYLCTITKTLLPAKFGDTFSLDINAIP